MKKYLYILPLFLLVAIPVIAANNGVSAQGSTTGQNGTATQTQQQLRLVSPSPSGNQVQNQNQVTTKNQGEDSQLKVQNQEEESLGTESGEGLQTRSQVAIERMSNVAKQVQLLLQTRTTGGIGEQVRVIAQAQNEAQTLIQDEIDQIDSRKGILKSIIGPNYEAVKNLKMQLEQNQLRIQQLTQLKNQLYNQGDITNVQEAIQTLTEQNTALQDIINAEGQVKSIFGWLLKLFVK